MLWIRKPWWHALVFNDFDDRVFPAHDFVVAGERKRSDFAVTMAFDAAFVEDPGNLIRIGNVAAGFNLADPPNVAPEHFCGRNGDGLVGK